MKTRKHNINEDLLKNVKKQLREEEIANFGHAIYHANVYKNKKAYSRKAKHKISYELV